MHGQGNTRFNRKVVIVTGELSGEIHGAYLVEAISRRVQLEFTGIGSNKLASSGVRIIQDYEAISLVGLSEILSKITHIRRAYGLLKAHLKAERPSLLILVDFPGFNLRMARIAHGLGIPTIYVIPPQVWAWNKGRIVQIKKYVDLVICILPFEEPLYRDHGVPVVYVGHPYAETVKPLRSRQELLSEIGVKGDPRLLSILPGSRENEISAHLPILLRVIEIVRREIPDLVVLMPLSDNTKDDSVRRFLRPGTPPPVITLRGRTYDALAASDAAIIASGSATLEAALLGTPSVVLYKVSWISYVLAKLLVNVDYISLPNLIADKPIFPEHIQRIDPEKIAEQVISMVKDGTAVIREELKKLCETLGNQDSYSRAADAVIEHLEKLYGPLS